MCLSYGNSGWSLYNPLADFGGKWLSGCHFNMYDKSTSSRSILHKIAFLIVFFQVDQRHFGIGSHFQNPSGSEPWQTCSVSSLRGLIRAGCLDKAWGYWRIKSCSYSNNHLLNCMKCYARSFVTKYRTIHCYPVLVEVSYRHSRHA